MPRKPRVISSTGIYHIILRSVNQHIIFEEEADYRKFLYILADCREFYDMSLGIKKEESLRFLFSLCYIFINSYLRSSD